jgi:hypothetical protein
MTSMLSTAVPFRPPKSSGKGRARRPKSAKVFQAVRSKPSADFASARRCSKA